MDREGARAEDHERIRAGPYGSKTRDHYGAGRGPADAVGIEEVLQRLS